MRQRLALLLGEQAGELGTARLKCIGNTQQRLPPLLYRGRRPGGKSTFRRRHGGFELCLVRPRAAGQQFSGGRIDHVQHGSARDQLPVDQQLVISARGLQRLGICAHGGYLCWNIVVPIIP
jgi:hypothetical protein